MDESPKTPQPIKQPDVIEAATTQQHSSDDLANQLKDWQALSPWSIITYIFSTLKGILSNGFAVIPLVYTGWKQGFDAQWFILALSAIIILVSIAATIEWRKFRFRLNGEQLEVKRGLFFTKKDEIPLTRIQNIRYEQPFYFKPLSLGTLVIETAGSKKDEAQLAALDTQQAQTLKRLLLKLKQSEDPLNHSAQTTDASLAKTAHTEALDSQPIARKSFGDLLLFGFYHNNFIWFAVIAGPVLGQLNVDKVFDSPLAKQFWLWIESQTHQNIGLQSLFFIMGLLFLYGLFSLISIIAAVLKYYPYKLDRHDDTLQRSGGVISHQQDALAIKRVQLIHAQQPVLARLFKRWTLYFKQVKGQEVEQKTKQHMLIPSVKPNEVESILTAMPNLSGGAGALPRHYTHIHINWFTRRIMLPLAIAILLSVIAWFDGRNLSYFETTWLITSIVIGVIYLRYRHWGYVLEDKVVWQHTGLLGRQWKRIAFDKVQHVKITQTQGQKRSKLAYVEVGLASGSIVFPYVPTDIAEQIISRSLHAVNRNTQNWI
ncbi:PH domain-containing protein [Shewanella sp. MF05960]|uniref:PH domain-containing protein n=1 Tax=Shewanella sp. MF05960 TaxID=3434874 RepID=UPI003D7B63F5